MYMVRAGLSDSASLLREIEPEDVLLCHVSAPSTLDRCARRYKRVRSHASVTTLLYPLTPTRHTAARITPTQVQAMEFQNNVLLRPESLTPGTPPDRRRLNGITILCDLTGLGLHNLTPSVYKIVQMIAKIDQVSASQQRIRRYHVRVAICFCFCPHGRHHAHRMLAKIDQDNYPENLAKMYIINAPVMFNMVWKVSTSSTTRLS